MGYFPNVLLMEDMTILDDQLSEGFMWWELDGAGENFESLSGKITQGQDTLGKINTN